MVRSNGAINIRYVCGAMHLYRRTLPRITWKQIWGSQSKENKRRIEQRSQQRRPREAARPTAILGDSVKVLPTELDGIGTKSIAYPAQGFKPLPASERRGLWDIAVYRVRPHVDIYIPASFQYLENLGDVILWTRAHAFQ